MALDGRTGKPTWRPAPGTRPGPRRERLGRGGPAPDATAAGDLVLTASGDAVVASRAGREIWRRPGAARVLGIRAGRAVLLAADLRLIVRDATTGTQRSAFPLYVPTERVEPWQPGRWQLTDSCLAMERLLPKAGADPGFHTTDPVVIAAIQAAFALRQASQ